MHWDLKKKTGQSTQDLQYKHESELHVKSNQIGDQQFNTNRSHSDIFVCCYREDGVSGLFRGLESKLLQTVLTAALMFLSYEKISSAVLIATGLTQQNS